MWLLLRDPAAWSAERYRVGNAMHYTALHPERWRRPADPAAPPGRVAPPPDTR